MNTSVRSQPALVTQGKHVSVMLNEALTYLAPERGGVYLDATFGGGGHTRALLERFPDVHVVGMDWDMQSLETHGTPLQEEFPHRLTLLWGNFALLERFLKKAGVGPFDGILADFGTSRFQIEQGAGFSVHRDTPLDMRMSPSHQTITAEHVVNHATERELSDIFWMYGEERYARRIAAAIVQDRARKKFTTTQDLASLIERLAQASDGKRDRQQSGKRSRIHPATRVFQALRIYVNKELDNIKAFLAASLKAVKPHGRIVCISFHSLEDGIVKQFIRQEQLTGTREIENLTPRVVVPTEEEITQNPPSRSAKLRAFSVGNSKYF